MLASQLDLQNIPRTGPIVNRIKMQICILIAILWRVRPRCLRLGAGGFFGGNPHRGDGFDTPSPLGSSSVRLRAETAASIYRADRTVSGGWARDGRRRAPSFTAMP